MTIHPRKSLGQNFLVDRSIAQRIVSSLGLDTDHCVVEIGCGTGALTELLVRNGSRFIGIEIDTILFDGLVRRFGERPQVRFMNVDVLTVDLNALLRTLSPPTPKVVVVGNLPFYISSPILGWLGNQASRFNCAFVMLQSEVAERLWAMPCSKEYGVLTLTTTYYFETVKLFDVGPGAFRPIPKVNSTVVKLTPKARLPLERPEEFFRLVKRAFSHRRKTLRNCLKGMVSLATLDDALKTIAKPDNVRAEALSLEDFLLLFSRLQQ